MTYKAKLLATALGLSCLLLSAPASADSLIIALAGNGNPEQRKAEVIDAIKLVTQATDIGETSYFINGMTGQSIASFTVPKKKSYASDKAKINANKSGVKAVIDFAAVGDPNLRIGAMDISGTVRTILKSFDVDQIDAIIFIGNPLYHDDRELRLSMASAHIPSDDHILSRPTQSHFGMAGLNGHLNGTAVHIATQGYDWAQNTRHQGAVERFYSLTTSYLGGALVTFAADRGRIIERVKNGITTAPQPYEIAPSGKREMLFVGRDPHDAVPIHQRDLSSKTLTLSEARRALNVEIGVTWDCSCDVDIYVRPDSFADTLYYGNQRTREGVFRKDYRDASELLNGLETVAFDAPVNLEKMLVGVNLYSGSASSGVSGEIRIALGGQTYAKQFTITAPSGNEGAGSNTAFETLNAPNDHWVMMRGVDIVTDHLAGDE